MVACKVPTSSPQPAHGVLAGLQILTATSGTPASLAHGTTIVTNAIVERRTSAVGLLTTRGFRDVLEIARQNRTHLYHLDLPAKPEPLVPRRLRVEVTGRSEEHTSELQSLAYLVCRLLLGKKKIDLTAQAVPPDSLD